MIASKSNVTIRDFRRIKNDQRQDPIKDLSFIPSPDNEFLYLLGLDEVVKFRVERLDKIIFVPDKCGAYGKQKKSPSLVMPARPPKDPFTCAECNTDFSSSWKQDNEGSILCWFCFQYIWRKKRWTPNGPKDSHIGSNFGNSSSPGLTSHSVHNDLQVKQETSSFLLPMKSDQEFPKIPASVCSGQIYPHSLSSPSFYSDSSLYCSSPTSSDIFPAPFNASLRSPSHTPSSSLSSPRVYSDSSSYCSSPSSDIFSSPVYLPSNSSSPDGSLGLHSISNLHSASPPPSFFPPHTEQVLQKDRPHF